MNKTPEQHGELQAYEEASKRLGVPAEDLIAMSELSKATRDFDLEAHLLEAELKNILRLLDASYVWHEDQVLLTDPFYLIGAHEALRKLSKDME